MKTYWVAFFLIVMLPAAGQQAPWTGLPAQKNAMDARMDETTIYLSLDTLYKYDNWELQEYVGKLLYKDSVDLVGYGYRDKAGRPYGLWKYYIPTGKGYELYSEGYYTTVKPENLWVGDDITSQFPIASAPESKADFINGLDDSLLFTGEWRFYSQGRLHQIVVLDDKVRMPYAVAFQDGGVTALMIAHPERRLTGKSVSSASFSSTGYLKWISGLGMEFDSNGKPIIRPLHDLDFPLYDSRP